jgi:hypothetical protein
VANSDSQPQSQVPAQTGPVTTGVEPSATCDADGDGVTDPGAPSTCTTTATPGTVDTGVQQGTVAPVPYSAPKKQKAAPKKAASQSSPKKVRQRRASAR